LAVADGLGDPLGQLLGAQRVPPTTASPIASLTTSSKREVGTLLVGAQVDEALKLGVVGLLLAGRADADDLLDAGDADPRERDVDGGLAVLELRAIR
jgi:hypothetical protein